MAKKKSKAKYNHHRQLDPNKVSGNYDTIPFCDVEYNSKYKTKDGKSVKRYHKKGSGAKVYVAKDKKTGKDVVQSILIPKPNTIILKNNPPDIDFHKAQLLAGANEEYEHTDQLRTAKEIAKAHIKEFAKPESGKIKSDYYPELKKLEKKLDKKIKTQKKKK